jgi:hypothetical protein
MFENCQETFQHAVAASEGSWNDFPRISIVFKKSLLLSGGRRGHGIPKQNNNNNNNNNLHGPNNNNNNNNDNNNNNNNKNLYNKKIEKNSNRNRI